jgi:SAM-dependent methyltransferase
MKQKEWFEEWFNTPYYHILYKNRDDHEAERFIRNLCDLLKLKKDSYILDLACGKGRHSITLNKLGFKVLGADLSSHSISEAAKQASENLSFLVHDMREVIPHQQFDAIFNLFTSFGYFDETTDNEKVLRATHEMLNENGILVIDFMNAKKVADHLVESEVKTIDNLNFHINRRFDGKHIFKQITFQDHGEEFNYTERVQALRYSDFESMLNSNGFKILRIFGDFDLNEFQENTSDRLILIAQKN